MASGELDGTVFQRPHGTWRTLLSASTVRDQTPNSVATTTARCSTCRTRLSRLINWDSPDVAPEWYRLTCRNLHGKRLRAAWIPSHAAHLPPASVMVLPQRIFLQTDSPRERRDDYHPPVNCPDVNCRSRHHRRRLGGARRLCALAGLPLARARQALEASDLVLLVFVSANIRYLHTHIGTWGYNKTERWALHPNRRAVDLGLLAGGQESPPVLPWLKPEQSNGGNNGLQGAIAPTSGLPRALPSRSRRS